MQMTKLILITGVSDYCYAGTLVTQGTVPQLLVDKIGSATRVWKNRTMM